MQKTCQLLLAFFYLSSYQVDFSHGHGRLMDPPARNCMWRYGFPSPVNYDDNQNWCGGAQIMNTQNKGKCGICGDNYADPAPREHELGGMYSKGIIVKRYVVGQTLDVEVELTTNHQGTFEFKICPSNDPKHEVTQECLDNNKLEVLNDDGRPVDKYTITTKEKSETFFLPLKLPQYLSCTHCVLQWTYVAANTWGPCGNGTEAVGCGPQETFINCADIAILSNTGGFPPPLVVPKNVVYIGDNETEDMEALVVRPQICVANQNSTDTKVMDEWCMKNCLNYPPHCPEDKCTCLTECEAIGAFQRATGSDLYCTEACLSLPLEKCPKDKCRCF